MRDNVRQAVRDQFVIDAARLVTRGLPARDYRGQAAAIRAWVKSHLRFVRDPNGVELLTLPRTLLKEIIARSYTSGDCDDAATLSASLLVAVGFPCRFEAVAFFSKDAPYQHVYTVAEFPGGEMDMDTTRPSGIADIQPSRKLIQRI